MTTLSLWTNWAVSLGCETEGVFWSGARLISSNKTLILPRLDTSVTLESIGYTGYKLTRLHDGYFVQDAVETAMMLHSRNVARKKYASSAFHCYGHLLKNDPDKKSKRASVMGPCIQSVVLTLKPHEGRTTVTVNYRTTEIFKKFPADIVWLRERILPLIPSQDKYPVTEWRFNFVNVTSHPMYVAAVLPHLPDAIATMHLWRERNPAFWQWSLKWLARYLIGGAAGRSIEKFAQAQRTAMSAVSIIGADRDLHLRLVQYLHDNREHALPRNTRFDLDEISSSFDDALRRLQ